MQNVGSIDRRTYLGSSDVAAILGISPWSTPSAVYDAKVFGKKEVISEDKQKILMRGKRLEPYVLDMLTIEHDVELIHRGNRYLDRDHKFLAAEIDAETADGRNVEAKTTGDFYDKSLWGEEGSDDVPIYYAAQCMHGMMCNGAQSTLLPVMLGIDDFRVYEIHRDESVIAAIKATELEFWDRIQRRDPPPPTNAADVLRMFPSDNGTTAQATPDMVEVVNEWKAKKKEAKFIKGEIKDLEDQIKLFMLDATTLSYGSRALLTWKEQKTNRFNIDLFRALHPKIATKFTRTDSSRVLRPKK